MGLLSGKKILLTGVLNNKSIAWGVAQECAKEGAELCLTYQNEVAKKRVLPLAEELKCNFTAELDVSTEENMDKLFAEVSKKWNKIDGLLHCLAFSDKNELEGGITGTSMANFTNALNISAYSLIGLSARARKMMTNGGSVVTLTYFGAEKWVPNYNVMGIAKSALETSVKYLAPDLGADGIRVNAISSGPVKTLAASGISDFNYMLKYHELNTPLKRNTTIEENGKTAVYLFSDFSSNVTGEVIHVDGGYHVMGMKDPNTENLELPKSV
ncbi:MAG: enoyl-ACP reductase [Rickettsiales bacterium]|jgi:enoyl-[acyl-carrier protein] reductase I|nr:enoyl-ACP reductase [Rickettsiales bacterium]